MAQAKKKLSTKTAKKATASRAKSVSKKKACSCKSCCTSNRERMHVFVVTALAMTAAIILCTDAAIMIFC